MVTENLIDKTQWLAGPWQTEPDKAYWVDEKTGFDCLIVRQPNHGALCGYVGVKPNHRSFEVHYDEIYSDVHGGLTFSGPCQKKGLICHPTSEKTEDKIWWFGFDCAHGGDQTPNLDSKLAMIDLGHRTYGSYKNFDYVRKEIAVLARELKGVS